MVVRLSALPANIAQRLALGLAANGKLFPHRLKEAILMTPRGRVAVIIGQLIKRQPLGDQMNLATVVLERAHPLPFAWWCWSYIRPQDHEVGVDNDGMNTLAVMVANRTREEAHHQSLIERYPEEFSELLHSWAVHGDRGEVKDYVATLIGDNPASAEVVVWLSFIRRHVFVNGFGEPQYDDLAEIVEPAAVYSALVRAHPNLASEDPKLELDDVAKARVLQQFVAIYRKRSQSG
jgi:hypothetical protein